MTIAEWLKRCAQWHPGKEAVVDGERRLTYAQFAARANRQANALRADGVGRGDRVAVMLNNGLEAIESMAAAAKGALVHVPLNVRLSAREVGDILRNSGTRAIIVDAEYRDKLDAAGTLPALQRIVVVSAGRDSEYERWMASASDGEPPVDVTGDDDFFIYYTGGTTGAPKGAHFKHRQAVAHAMIPVHYYEMNGESRLLLAYPHNSIAAANMFYFQSWLLGATIVLFDVRKFSGERWLRLVEKERITHSHLVPTMLFRVLETPGLETFDHATLRTVGYGSAPMPLERVERLREVFGDILVHGYGMTEISSLATVLTKSDHIAAVSGDRKRLSSCGRPVFGCEVRVVDDAGRDVAPGTIGEIIMRGPTIMCGYWDDPVRTAEAIRDGWMYSGDLATVDEGGYLTIVDRKKDLIITGGANVSSRDVEEVLYWHPAVREAAVVGRPDTEWGECVHAFVSLHEGVTVSEEELFTFVRDRLARYKCPSSIDIVDDLPKSPLGKILKAQLRKQLTEGKKVTA